MGDAKSGNGGPSDKNDTRVAKLQEEGSRSSRNGGKNNTKKEEAKRRKSAYVGKYCILTAT